MKFGTWTTPPCYSPAPSSLRLCFHPASSQLLPCRTPALHNPSSYPATSQLLPCAFLAPTQFLPSSTPLSALLCSTLLSSAPALFLPYSSLAPVTALLLLCYYPAPSQLHLLSCHTPALLLPNSYPAPSQLLPSSSSATAQLLPSSCLLSIHLCSTKLSFCPVPALLLPCSCFYSALALILAHSYPSSACSWFWFCQVQFGSLHHHQHLTTFFGTAIAAFYGSEEANRPFIRLLLEMIEP